MIQLYECPTCGRDTAAEVLLAGLIYCPACAPTPDDVPHYYRPLATGGVVKLTDEQARELSEPPGFIVPRSLWNALTARASYARNGVCCLDPGDCNGPCELV